MNNKHFIILVNSRLGTRDTISLDDLQNKNFGDLARKLWNKHGINLLDYAEHRIGDFENNPERMPIKFTWTDARGYNRIIEISLEIEVLIEEFEVREIYWDHVPLGGDSSAEQEFNRHALDLLNKPEYSNWRCIYIGKPEEGITATGPDKSGIIRTITITPTGGYPRNPPKVHCEPTFTNDPCWSSGCLHFSYYKGNAGSPWEDMVKKAARGLNPLHLLVQELLYKYQFGV